MVASLIFAAVLAPQFPTLTYTTVAKRLDHAVAEIAAATGQNLVVGSDAANHYLVISVEKAPLEESLRKIAEVTESRWVSGDAGQLILEPDEVGRRTAAREALAARAEELRGSLDQRTADMTEEEAELYETPAAKTARLIGFDALAAIPLGERAVWALTPTRVQRPLNVRGMQAIIAGAVTEHNQMAADAAMMDDPFLMAGGEEMMEIAKLFGYEEAPDAPIEAPPAEALFIVERGAQMFGDLSMQLRLYDANGAVVGRFADALWNMNDEIVAQLEMEAEGGAEPEPVIPEDERAPIEWSDKTHLLIDVASGMMGQLTEPLDRAKLLEAIGDPVAVEPLSLEASDVLLSIARAKKLDLVANVPDSFGSSVQSFTADAPTVHAAIEGLKSDDDVTLEIGEQWMVVKPRDGAAARERFSRAALKRLIDTFQATGALSLDTIAEYASTEEQIAMLDIRMIYAMLFAPPLFTAWSMDPTDWDALRFWGSLSEGQKSNLKAGGQLRFGGLSGGAQAALSAMLYGTDHGLMSLETAKKMEELPSVMTAFGGMAGAFGGGSDFRTEPTEVMPTGLPAAGVVRCAPEATHYAVVASEEATGQAAFMQSVGLSADMFAMIDFMVENVPDATGQAQAFEEALKQLRYGNRLVLDLTFLVAPEVVAQRSLIDDSPPGDEIVSREGLPAAFTAQIQQAKKDVADSPFAKLMQGIIGSMGGGQIEPPQ